MQRIAEIATVGVCTHSPDGLLTWANSKDFELTGASQRLKDLYKYKDLEYVLDEDREKAKENFLRCLETKIGTTLKLRLDTIWQPQGTKRDEPCWVMTTITPETENGKIVELLSCITDVSHPKWAQKLLTEAAEAVRRAKQLQDRLIDTTSHEIRNPLSAILQSADDIAIISATQQVLCDTVVTSHFKKAYEDIGEDTKNVLFCAAHQRRIVDDILTVSKLDSSLLKIETLAVSPEHVLREAVQPFMAEMVADNIDPIFETRRGYTDLYIQSVYMDPARVTQILVNLVANDIKSMKMVIHKRLCVRLDALTIRTNPTGSSNQIRWFPSSAYQAFQTEHSMSESSNDDVNIVFEVEDSGAGISEDEIAYLCERSAHAILKTHVNYGGSGLGLLISRELAELEGGTLGVRSRSGSGSIFAFYITAQRATLKETNNLELQLEVPRPSPDQVRIGSARVASPGSRFGHSAAHSKPADSNNPAQLVVQKTLSILFVEENLINQKVLSEQLERMDSTVYKANHGVEALKLIRQSTLWVDHKAGSSDIDLVLMDWE